MPLLGVTLLTILEAVEGTAERVESAAEENADKTEGLFEATEETFETMEVGNLLAFRDLGVVTGVEVGFVFCKRQLKANS